MNYQITGSENTLEIMIKSYELSEPGEKITYYLGEFAPEHSPNMIDRDNKKHMMLCALFIFAWNEMCDGKAILGQKKVYGRKRENRDELRSKGKFTSKSESNKRNSTIYIIIKREERSKDSYRDTFEKKECPEILTRTIKKLSQETVQPLAVRKHRAKSATS